MSSNTKKLAVLRSRTDDDLVVLIQRELNRGFRGVDVVYSTASPAYIQALRAHGTAASILPRISGLAPADRAELQAKLTELRARLDQVPAANVQSFRASFAS